MGVLHSTSWNWQGIDNQQTETLSHAGLRMHNTLVFTYRYLFTSCGQPELACMEVLTGVRHTQAGENVCLTIPVLYIVVPSNMYKQLHQFVCYRCGNHDSHRSHA
jgi:hypothetical protein